MILFILVATSCVLGTLLRASPVFSLALAIPALACATILLEAASVLTGLEGVSWYYLPLAIVVMEGSYVASSLLAGALMRRVPSRTVGL